ncbi:hypothetical protein A3A05_01620 [Candidatus Nomurabacteria bacterium RIFCSPLOWO2_01_FULL_41_12]|uniref:PPC domain-containing protein n=1 Tax=Candidatus Nomurabacteria bacterium RIFCSPLOWO2_01_FULL_41_12 TaxID=1801774 RepID=A0A1F6WUN2_9BACT|nr:MAG: hypothetical protein A3A05_01620 [Candidatus Nomurabacteria bacterium RIFCSPLOWO2_01_FULL_41_12]
MQIILESQNKSVIKIEKGEDCLEILKSLAKERDKSFLFSIIGACSLVELSYYDLKNRKYFSKEFTEENMEILNVNGNVAWSEDEPIVHAHGVFSNENYETFGGHVVKLVISLTGETIIDWLPEKIIKKYDEETGLKLLSK